MPARSWLWAALSAALALVGSPVCARNLTEAEIAAIVDLYGQEASSDGYAVGVGIGVVQGGRIVVTRGFGYADAASRTPFTAGTLFEIASNTKVFTTNLLGQDIQNKTLLANTRLGQLSAVVGAIAPIGGRATLADLADFTAGYPTYAPLCQQEPAVVGCMPNTRPNLAQYSPTAFLSYFQNNAPADQTVNPPTPLRSLPGPYVYSDFSTGLLGLIIATPTKAIDAHSVSAWSTRVSNEILSPLGMASTYLTVPAGIASRRISLGYSPAVASATVDAEGKLSLTLDVGGAGYDASHPPAVTITGGRVGSGTGATATAVVSGGAVSRVRIEDAGSGYIPAASISFTSAKPVSKAAVAQPIVRGGKIAGFTVISGGSGYTTAPTVVISGGRRSGSAARDATAVAHVAKGRVTAVTVVDGGAGYVEPLRVAIEPGAPVADTKTGVVTAWAAAGGLASTIDDMVRFVAAAVFEPTVGGKTVPPALTEGFRIAETTHACEAPATAQTPLDQCQVGSGFAWEIQPAVTKAGQELPELVSKNGGLNGFSSQIMLAPSRRLGVVVFVNARDGDPTAVPEHAYAPVIANNVLYSILYAQGAN